SYIGGDGNDVTLTPMPRFSYDALTVVSSSYNPSRDGQAVTFTATVRSASSPTPGTGSVSFYDGAVPLGSASLSASGKATLTITLPAGGHAITAAYPGSEVFASSRGTLRQNVGPVRT